MNISVLWNVTPYTVVYVKYTSVENASSVFRKMEPGGSKIRELPCRRRHQAHPKPDTHTICHVAALLTANPPLQHDTIPRAVICSLTLLKMGKRLSETC
jgi:hypothetical protein